MSPEHTSILLHAIDLLELIALAPHPDLLLKHTDSNGPILLIYQLGISGLHV